MKNNFKRCLALLLALMTIVGAFSIPVSAAEACDHDWKVYGEIVKPTCTAQGYTTEFCAKCQEYRITDVKSKLPHEHVPATKEALPTCSKWGYFVGALVCPLCGDIDDTNWTQEQKEKYKPVDTLPTNEAELKKDKYHKWGDPTFEGEACVGDTYKVKYTCSECKKTIVFDKTGSGAHKYEYTNRVNPTCQTEGSVVRTCKDCGEKTTLKIEKSAHTFDGKNVKYDFVKVGNDSKAQHQSYENCTVCGAKGNQGAKSNHNWDETKTVTVASTCAALGKETKTCKDCGYVKDFKFTSQPDHTYNSAIVVSRVEAKHTAASRVHAYTEYRCTTCGNNFKLYDGYESHNMRWVPENLNDHDWKEDSRVDGTCFVAGAVRYVCKLSTCGAEKNVAVKAAHLWVKDPTDTSKDLVTTVKPTCSDKGYNYKTCQYCGHVEKSDWKDPLKSDGTHKKTTEDITKEGYIKATCLYDGKIPLWCADCNAVAGYKTVAKINTSSHKASQAKVTYEGSGCFDNRYKVTTCEKGCTLADDTTPAFIKDLVIERVGSHNYVKDVVVKEATCYSVGINGKECDRCKAAGINSVIETEFTSFSEKHTGIQVYSVNAETYWNGTGLNISNPHPNYATTGEKWDDVDFNKYSCDEPIYEWWYCNACHRNYRAPMKAQVETVTKTGSFYIESTKKYVTKVTLNPVSGSHTFYVEVKTAASCFATGEGIKKCTECAYSETITLPKIPHAILKHPTQTDKDGKPVDLKIEVNATYDNLGTVTGATCTSAFNWKKWCTTCNSYVEFGTDAALSHKMPDKWESTAAPAVAATCVTSGVARRDCERFASCGYYETKTVNATGKHSGSKYAGTPATCTAAGVKDTFKCTVCTQLFEQVKDKDGNVTSTPVVKEPAVIAPLGHQKYEDAIKSYKKNNETKQHDLFKGTPVAPTCTAVGYTPILCKTCKKVEIGQTDYQPMTAHNYILANNDGKIDETDYDPANVVEATCQDYWYKYIACSTCDGHFYKITDASKPKKPHVNAAGDTLTGSCLLELDDYNCVNGTTAHKVEPKHNWTEKYSAACHGTSKYCDVCDTWEFVVDKDKKATHTFPTDTADYIKYVAPTMTTKGYEEKACIVCGYVQAKVLDKLPAVTFSLEAVNANDAAAVIVNGGKIYVNIKMDAQDVEVNGIRLSIEYDPAVLTLLKDESREIATVFGALTGGSNKPAVNEQLVGTKKVVTIYDEAGSIRENVAIGNADLFATLVFQVNPTAYAKKDYVKTALSFYAGYDVAENPYMSQVISKTADGYADNNFSYDEAIEIKVKQLGDYNNDGLVDSKDVSAVADLAVYNFTEKKYDAVLDIDHDGDIDFDDYKYIKLFQVPGSYKTESEFYDVAIYEARLKAEAEAAKKDNEKV